MTKAEFDDLPLLSWSPSQTPSWKMKDVCVSFPLCQGRCTQKASSISFTIWLQFCLLLLNPQKQAWWGHQSNCRCDVLQALSYLISSWRGPCPQPGVVRGTKPTRPVPLLTFPSLFICFFICLLPKRISGGMPSKITSKISKYPQPPQHKGNQYHWCLGLLWWRGFQKEVMWEDLTPAEIAECQELVLRGSPHGPHTKSLSTRSSPHL